MYIDLSQIEGLGVAGTPTGGVVTVQGFSDGRVRTGAESLLFFDAIEGTTVNPNLYTQKTSGMTITQNNAFITANANSTLTLGSYAILQTMKFMPILVEYPLSGKWHTKIVGAVGSIVEIGFINIPTNTGAPTDGCFLRWDATGALFAVLNNNGTETLTSVGVVIPATNFYSYEITIYKDSVSFKGTSSVSSAPKFNITVTIPGTSGSAINATHIQACIRVYNTAATTTATQVLLSGLNVQQLDLDASRPYREQLAVAAARGSYQYPAAPYTSTTNSLYNTATPSATLSGIVPSYTTLGGKFVFTVPAGNDAVDYAFYAFQIPVGYQLNVTQITIDAAVGTALVGGAILQWTVGLNSTGVSLATLDNVAAQTASPRRLPVGQQSFNSTGNGTSIGASATEINLTFDPGMVCDSGRYFHLILKLPIASAGGTVRGSVMIRGYFE